MSELNRLPPPAPKITSRSPTLSQNVCHQILLYAPHQAPKLSMIRHHLSASGLAEKSRGNGSLSRQKHTATALIWKKKTKTLSRTEISPRCPPNYSSVGPGGRLREPGRKRLGLQVGLCETSHPGTGRRAARQNASARPLSRRSAAPAPPLHALQRPLAPRAGGGASPPDPRACAGLERVPSDGAGWQGGGACAAGRGGLALARGGRCEEKGAHARAMEPPEEEVGEEEEERVPVSTGSAEALGQAACGGNVSGRRWQL